jgi:outer membrane immunogenic protein
LSKLIMTVPALALATTAAPAYAQDATWTGFYIGAHGAMVDTDPEWTGTSIFQSVDGAEGGFTVTSVSVPIAEDPGGSEVGGGGRIGFNLQAGNFVFGAEADATLFDFDGSATTTQGGSTYTVSSHASNILTARARAGVAFGSAMVFVTGGAAFSHLQHDLTATNVSEVVIDGGEGGSTVGTTTANLAASADSGTGLALGGGGELRLNDNLSLALTVLHIDFGSENLAASAPPSSIGATVDTKVLIGMLGLNLNF